MNKIAHIFDLDNCIFEVDRKIWIVDKENPSVPLMKISESDFNLIDSGIFKLEDNKITFSGRTYWIPNTLYNQIKVNIKKNRSNLNNLGISMQEFLNEDVINDLEVNINMNNLKHLKNTTDDIIFVASKTLKNKYKKHIKKLEETLQEEGMRIAEWFYINQTFYNQTEDSNAFKKSLIVTRLLTGQVPDMKKFTEQTHTTYDEVNYYDTSIAALTSVKNTQDIIDALYTKTDKGVKGSIKENLSNELKLNVVQVTTNEMNPFVKTEIKIIPPRSIMSFESFGYVNEATKPVKKPVKKSYGGVNFKQTYSTFIRNKVFKKFGKLKQPFHFMLMNLNVYKKIYNMLKELYTKTPPTFELKRFPFFKRNLTGYKDFNFLRLMHHYDDQIFSDEMWKEYEALLTKTDKKGKKGEKIYKHFLDKAGIKYTEPSEAEDKGGYDLFLDNNKVQVKACNTVETSKDFRGNPKITLVGSTPALYKKKLEKVDTIVVVVLNDRKIFTFSTKGISTNNTKKTISGTLLNVEDIPDSIDLSKFK